MNFQADLGYIAEKMDRAIRKWLILPGELPIEAFYANIEDGGLQLPNPRYELAIAKITRLKKMGDNADPPIRKLITVEPTKSKLKRLRK